jgi:hypothetical protein
MVHRLIPEDSGGQARVPPCPRPAPQPPLPALATDRRGMEDSADMMHMGLAAGLILLTVLALLSISYACLRLAGLDGWSQDEPPALRR